MPLLVNIDLASDPGAASYLKEECVDVVFASEDGELLSREGPNRYRATDALVTGSTGDLWSVSRERFDLKYERLAGPALERMLATAAGAGGNDVHSEHGAALGGRFKTRPMPVFAKQIREPFSIHRSKDGDLLHGGALDWLLEYAPGDYGVVERARFEQVYRPIAPPD